MTEVLKIGEWLFYPATHQLQREQQTVALENRQAQLLLFLARNRERDLSKDELFSHLWRERVVNDDALYVCVANLRKALGDKPRSPQYIKTLPGFGYRFLADVTSLEQHKDALPRAGESKTPIWIAAGGIALAVVLGGIFSAVLWQPTEPNPSTEPPAIIADDYRRARFLLNQGEEHFSAGLALLQQVMATAPTYADAYALAAYQQGRRLYGAPEQDLAQVNAWIDHALKLEPDHPKAHLAKANIMFTSYWDFAQARHHFERGLADAESYFDYAHFLLAKGDFERALEYTYRYQDLDPQGYSVASVAWIETMAGHHKKALESINKLHAIDPHNIYYHVSRQAIMELQGNATEAYHELHWLMGEAGYPEHDRHEVQAQFKQQGLAGVYAWLAHDDDRHLNIGQYDPPLSRARYAISAGEPALALELLQQAVASRQVEVLWLAVDPKYRPLYDYAAFQDLLRKIGLTEGVISSSDG